MPLNDVTNQIMTDRANTASAKRPRRSSSIKSLRKLFGKKCEKTKQTGRVIKRGSAESLDDEEREAWRRAMLCSSSSTSSATSEDDYPADREVLHNLRRGFTEINIRSYSDSDSSVNYDGGPEIRMQKMRRLQQRTSDDNCTVAPSLCGELIVKSLPRGSARDSLLEAGVAQYRSQLNVVVCGSSRKITITILAIKSIPQTFFPDGSSNKVYVKVSLSPDVGGRVRYRTSSQRVTGDEEISLHDAFTFDITRRDFQRRLLISAWSSGCDESEEPSFIGCMSFGLKRITENQEVIQGWYYFLQESVGRKKHLKCSKQRTARVKRRPPGRREAKVHFLEATMDKPDETVMHRRPATGHCGSVDRLLAGDHTKVHKSGQASCKGYVCDECNRERKRLSTVNKRRRVSRIGLDATEFVQCEPYRQGSCLDAKCGTAVKISNISAVEKMATMAVMRHDIGQTMEKGSREIVGRQDTQSSETPIGCRNVQPKNYSSADLVQATYRVESSQSDGNVFQTEVMCTLEDTTKGETDEPRCDFQLAPVQRTAMRAAKLVTPTDRRGPVLHKARHRRSVHLKPTDSVAKLRKLRTRSALPIPLDYSADTETSPENRDNRKCKEVIGRGAPSPESDDRGYHSDTGVASVQTTSEQCQSVAQTTKDDCKGLALGDASQVKSSNSPSDNFCQAIEGLLRTQSVVNETNEPARKNSLPDEKSKPGRFGSFKSWLQRKESINQKSAATANGASVKVKRSSSLMATSRYTCDGCLVNSRSLSELLDKRGGHQAFRTFLQREFSEENLDFWLECQNYKLLKNNKIRKTANKIFEEYVATGSPKEINIDCSTREETRLRLSEPEVETFDQASEKIFHLMESDSFRRFLLSDLAHKCKE